MMRAPRPDPRQMSPRLHKAVIDTRAAVRLDRLSPHEREDFLAEAEKLAGEARRRQGMRAFDYPKTAAAAHEAGHGIEFAASGLIPTSLKIYSAKRFGRCVWLGETLGTPAWRVDPTTPVEDILGQARHQIGGWCGEVLHEGPNFRLGSSLDEIVLFRRLIGAAAFRLGLNEEEAAALGSGEIAKVTALLTAHSDLHCTLTRRLIRAHAVRGKCLARLLAEVRPEAGVA